MTGEPIPARALDLHQKALGFLERSGLQPSPDHYALCFRYADGGDPELQRELDDLLRDDTHVPDGVAAALVERFVTGQSDRETLKTIGGSLGESASAALSLIKTHATDVQNFDTSLRRASADLADSADLTQTRAMVRLLTLACQDMQARNEAVEAKLERMRDEMGCLHQALDAIRVEARTDPLTGLANRAAFNVSLREAIALAADAQTGFCLAVCDIDHFKTFNDRHGHLVGDQVLKLVAKTLRECVRDTDVVARYGGEEFAFVLTGLTPQAAAALAERARRTIASRPLTKRSTGESLGQITVSIGIAPCKPDDTPDSLFSRADKCLYAAKSDGRNRVHLQV